MKNKFTHFRGIPFLLVISGWLIIGSVLMISSAHAQYYAYYTPAFNPFFCSFGYYPFISPLPVYPFDPYSVCGRRAHVPLTSTASLFPAPTLPVVPVATTGGVGVSTLIPTVPATVALPANSFVTTPLAGLITFTPLSLVGLTFAPVPVSAPPLPTPVTIPAPIPTITPAVTVGAATSAAVLSLVTSVLSGLVI